MLYEQFFKWLTRYNRRHCEHNFEKVGESHTMIHYDLFYYNHYKCTECGKKKKSLDGDKTHLSSGTYTYF